MRVALGIGVALVCCACGEESRVRPRTPVNALAVDPTCVSAPAIQDSFPEAFAAATRDDAYHVERPPHVDLGYIGDSPIGTEPNPPHVDPPWEQPFRLDRPCECGGYCPIAHRVPAQGCSVVYVISQ